MSEPITCRDVVELVSDYLGDGLTGEERVVLEQHLLVCPPCSTHLDQIRTTIALTKGLRTDKPMPVASALEVFRKWKAAR